MSQRIPSNVQYKPLQPSQISLSELNSNSVYNVLRNEYINPFLGTRNDELVNLSSGVPAPADVRDSMLNIHAKGEEQYIEFREKRLISAEVPLFAALPRNKYHCFGMKKVKSSKPVNIDTYNRNILSKFPRIYRYILLHKVIF